MADYVKQLSIGDDNNKKDYMIKDEEAREFISALNESLGQSGTSSGGVRGYTIGATNDANDCTQYGWYRLAGGSSNIPSWGGGILLFAFPYEENGCIMQLAMFNAGTSLLGLRMYFSGEWSDWKTFADTDDLDTITDSVANLKNELGTISNSVTDLKTELNTANDAISSINNDLSDLSTTLSDRINANLKIRGFSNYRYITINTHPVSWYGVILVATQNQFYIIRAYGETITLYQVVPMIYDLTIESWDYDSGKLVLNDGSQWTHGIVIVGGQIVTSSSFNIEFSN